MTSEYDEKALISKAKRGDAAAFAMLVRHSERTVYNLALRMLGDEQDALDISQEAYLRAWRSLGAFGEHSTFCSWMYAITRNVCVDFLKKRQSSSTVPLTYGSSDGDEAELQISDSEEELPEKQYEKKERRTLVREAIQSLPENQREVLVLYDIEGYSYADISRMLDIEEGTVKSRLWRARENLRKILKKTELFL